MNGSISDLLKLQKLDQRIQRIDKIRVEKPQKLEDTKTELVAIQKNFKILEEKIKNLRKEEALHEMTLKGNEEKILEKRKRLNIIKTNEELWAVQKEIDTILPQNSELEEVILEILEEIDQIDEEIKQQKILLQEREQNLQQLSQEVVEEMEVCEEEMGELLGEKEGISQEVPPETYKIYNKLFLSKKDRVVVEVVDQICQGCFMTVPPNVVELIVLSDNLIFCDSCARILFLKQNLVDQRS